MAMDFVMIMTKDALMYGKLPITYRERHKMVSLYNRTDL
jgi:hypothetical protein